MKMWSSLSSAIGLIFLFSLNGVRLLHEASISSEERRSIYCMLDNCPAHTTKPHYGCNNTENGTAACGETLKLITITKKIKKYLVNRHNTFRDIMAQGSPLQLIAAGRMYKLAWDRDLADVARLLVMRCDLRPTNSCISTINFPAPGSNEVYTKFKNKQDPYRIVRTQLNAWYDQYKYVDLASLIDGSSPNNFEVGHFLRMMVGPSNRLGCAMAATEKDDWNYQWLTCLYSCSPENYAPLYEFTSQPAAFCVNGADSKFQNLCSDQEAVDSCKHTELFQTAITNDTASQMREFMKNPSRNLRCATCPNCCFGGVPIYGHPPTLNIFQQLVNQYGQIVDVYGRPIISQPVYAQPVVQAVPVQPVVQAVPVQPVYQPEYAVAPVGTIYG